MKVRFKKLLPLLLAAALIFSMLPYSAAAGKETPCEVVEQTVVGEDTSVTIFRYTPTDFNFRGNNTPLLYVLGNEPYTKESAESMLRETGLKAIADKESCSVLFVSPSNGSTWQKEDYAAMQLLAGNATDVYLYGNDYSAGVSKEGKFYSGRFRHYIFAEGSAVTFAKEYLDTETAKYYLPEWYAWTDAFGAGYVYCEKGFTAANVAAGWNAVRKTNRMYINNGITYKTPYFYWEECGIEETVHTFETKYESLPTVEYYMYVPKTVDMSSKTQKYPLVLLFHGSGMHPQAIAQNTAWPVLGAKENFVVLSVNGMYKSDVNADAMADLIDYMVQNYAIDATRVYATGFSKGAWESMNIASKRAEKLAGIGLYEAVYDGFAFSEPKYTIPMYSISGQAEFYKVFPKVTQGAVDSLNTIGKVNGYSYTYDEKIGGLWGRTFDLTEAIPLPGERSVMNVHSIASEKDGVVYTKLVDVKNLSHNVQPGAAAMIWEFLSQFSRNADGTLNVAEKQTFSDVTTSDWYYYTVEAAARAKLFNGVSATEFEPEGGMSRAMFATVLYRAAGAPAVSGATSFTDVKTGKWYSDAVLWANENGVVNGVSATEFEPDALITREQAATMLYRYAKKLGLNAETADELAAFEDASAVSGYAKEAMAWAVREGIILGRGAGDKDLLAPGATLTRAEAAAVMLRMNVLVNR